MFHVLVVFLFARSSFAAHDLWQLFSLFQERRSIEVEEQSIDESFVRTWNQLMIMRDERTTSIPCLVHCNGSLHVLYSECV